MKPRVKNRNRFDVKYFFPDGASLRWVSNPDRSLTPVEMVANLREMIAVIEEGLSPLDSAVPAPPADAQET